MDNEVQLEILQILVNKSKSESPIPRYLAEKIRIEIMIEFVFLGIFLYKFKLKFLFNLNMQSYEISPPFRISICISLTILIERNPPGGGFFVGWFANQEPSGRGPPLKNNTIN